MTTLQFRRDSANNWESANPVLSDGEPGVATDLRKIKIGNGQTSWDNLLFVIGDPGEPGDKGDKGPDGNKGSTGGAFKEKLLSQLNLSNVRDFIISKFDKRSLQFCVIPSYANFGGNTVIRLVVNSWPTVSPNEIMTAAAIIDNNSSMDFQLELVDNSILAAGRVIKYNDLTPMVIPKDKYSIVYVTVIGDLILVDISGGY